MDISAVYKNGIAITDCNKKSGRHFPDFFFNLLLVHLTYAPVGTGEFQAFLARLNLFVNREIFLAAAFLCKVPLEAACMIFFSARANCSFAVSKSSSTIAASKLFRIALMCAFVRLFLAVFFSITRILFLADLMFATFHSPHFSQ